MGAPGLRRIGGAGCKAQRGASGRSNRWIARPANRARTSPTAGVAAKAQVAPARSSAVAKVRQRMTWPPPTLAPASAKSRMRGDVTAG